MYVLTGISLEKLSNPQKAVQTQTFKSITEIFGVIRYFGMRDKDSALNFTQEELEKEVEKQASNHKGMVISLEKYIWTVCKV